MELCYRGQWWPNRGTGGVSDNQGRALMFSRPGLTPSDQWAGSVPLGVWGEACRRRGRRWGLPSKRWDKAVDHGGSPGWTERTWGDCNPRLPIPCLPLVHRFEYMLQTSFTSLRSWRCPHLTSGKRFQREGSWRILITITICHPNHISSLREILTHFACSLSQSGSLLSQEPTLPTQPDPDLENKSVTWRWTEVPDPHQEAV